MDRPDNYDEWFQRQVAAGMSDIEAGKIIAHEEVMAEVRRLVGEIGKDHLRQSRNILN